MHCGVCRFLPLPRYASEAVLNSCVFTANTTAEEELTYDVFLDVVHTRLEACQFDMPIAIKITVSTTKSDNLRYIVRNG
jgi:hypothetical protein